MLSLMGGNHLLPLFHMAKLFIWVNETKKVLTSLIKNYFCIDYIACQLKKLSEIPVGYGRGYKHGDKKIDRILVIVIPDLLINLMSCRRFLKNIHYVVIIKCPKRMLEYYFSKVFTILECNYNNLEKLPNDVKQITHA